MKELENENRRLKKMYLEEKLKAEIVAEACLYGWPARRFGSASLVIATSADSMP